MDPDICSLCIATETLKRQEIQRALFPLLRHIDPSFKLIRLLEKPASCVVSCLKQSTKMSSSSGITCPAVSIMLFLHERGVICAEAVQQCFKNPPWSFHHRIELIHTKYPTKCLGCQNFYQLSQGIPLWSVCPIGKGNERLRINLYVRDFSAMTEFYRTITGVEMETSKENFCWFVLYSQPGIDIQLSLKRLPDITPYPLSTTYLQFKVSNLHCVAEALKGEITQVSDNDLAIKDPDGNTVILHEMEPQRSVTWKATSASQENQLLQHVENKLHQEQTSPRNLSDSCDSGRYSDSERCFSEKNMRLNQSSSAQNMQLLGSCSGGPERRALSHKLANSTSQLFFRRTHEMKTQKSANKPKESERRLPEISDQIFV